MGVPDCHWRITGGAPKWTAENGNGGTAHAWENKIPVKNEQEKSARVKTENKETSKSLFYGTSLATSSSVLDTSFQSDSSETSQNEN